MIFASTFQYPWLLYQASSAELIHSRSGVERPVLNFERLVGLIVPGLFQVLFYG
jgi:hypothetical protein